MKERSAFTLIELLIVVAIIAILAAIAVPNFLEARTRANTSRALNDLRTLNVGMEAYRVDNNVYPTSFARLSEPIAYLTEGFLPDPFRKSGIGSATTQNYRMYEATHQQGHDNYKVADSSPATGYLSWSYGPDLGTSQGVYRTKADVWENMERAVPSIGDGVSQTYNLPTGPGNAHGMIYDPTNGTVSVGDIYRWGGDALTD